MNLSSLSVSGFLSDYFDTGATEKATTAASGIVLNVTGERGIFNLRLSSGVASGSVIVTVDGVAFTMAFGFQLIPTIDFTVSQTMAYRNSLKVEIVSLSAGDLTVRRLS